MYVTLQLPEDSVHVVEMKVPVLLLVNVTVPVAPLGATVAMQAVTVLSGTLAAMHETAVVVVVTPWVTASRNVPALPV